MHKYNAVVIIEEHVNNGPTSSTNNNPAATAAPNDIHRFEFPETAFIAVTSYQSNEVSTVITHYLY